MLVLLTRNGNTGGRGERTHRLPAFMEGCGTPRGQEEKRTGSPAPGCLALVLLHVLISSWHEMPASRGSLLAPSFSFIQRKTSPSKPCELDPLVIPLLIAGCRRHTENTCVPMCRDLEVVPTLGAFHFWRSNKNNPYFL